MLVQGRLEDQRSHEHQEEQNDGQHVRNRWRHGRATGRTTVHPWPSTAGRPAMWHGLAVLGGTTVPPGTALPGLADAGLCGFANFDLFIPFSFIFWGPLLDLLESIFKVEWGFILASINSIREIRLGLEACIRCTWRLDLVSIISFLFFSLSVYFRYSFFFLFYFMFVWFLICLVI